MGWGEMCYCLAMLAAERAWTQVRERPSRDYGPEGRPGHGAGRGKDRIPEELLARLWQKRAARRKSFRTSGGRIVRVVYPGRSNTSAGPDFLDALLDVEGLGLVRGDVEIHVRQADWRGHGHGQDPNYNGVVLHAALDVESPTTDLPSGGQAQVVSLAPLLEDPDPPESGPNGALWAVLGRLGCPRPQGSEEAGLLLDEAGDRRFRAGSAYLGRLLEEQGAEQTLYEGIMEGLGYHSNQAPFLKLAGRAPYAALAEACRRAGTQGSRAPALEGWLLDLAGLGTGDAAPRPRTGFGAAMSAREWHCFRLRPANQPRRRIAGAARLLDRYLDEGLAHGLRRAADQGSPGRLTGALTVESGAGGGPAYIGKGRAADLAVNVALPFLDAWHACAGHSSSRRGRDAGERDSDDDSEYLALYRRFGRLQDNTLLREMREQLLPPAWLPQVNSARRQQGLLHLQSLLAGRG